VILGVFWGNFGQKSAILIIGGQTLEHFWGFSRMDTWKKGVNWSK